MLLSLRITLWKHRCVVGMVGWCIVEQLGELMFISTKAITTNGGRMVKRDKSFLLSLKWFAFIITSILSNHLSLHHPILPPPNNQSNYKDWLQSLFFEVEYIPSICNHPCIYTNKWVDDKVVNPGEKNNIPSFYHKLSFSPPSKILSDLSPYCLPFSSKGLVV